VSVLNRRQEAKIAKFERDQSYIKLGKTFISSREKAGLSDFTKREIYAARLTGITRFEANELSKRYQYCAGIYFLFDEEGKFIRIGQSKDVFDRLYKHCAADFTESWCSVSILFFSNTPTSVELDFAESHFIYQHQNINSRYDSNGKLNSPCNFDALMRLESAGIQSQIMPHVALLDWEKILPKSERIQKPRQPRQKLAVSWDFQPD